jgi:APA family basic amino acid/polyamine antiporter
MIPIAGSAYTYTYATLGELIAWIIGWDLILEYAGSNMSVSVGFAAHVVDLLDWFGLHPSARWISPAYLPDGLQDLAGNNIYNPGWHFGFNIPAFLIVLILTVVLVRGIRESASTNNMMVGFKLVAILIFVFAAIGFIHPSNWHPFMPNGWSGVLTGGSIIFFTYIGFDSVSTAAEECRNPQRDLPIGIIATLVVCTVLYVAVAVCLTGLVPWQSMVGDAAPVVNALKKLSLLPGGHSLYWIRLVVLLGALMGMISSILVYQIGQSRVWFSMSRDGLLPKVFSNVHPLFRTPAFSTWVAGIVVARRPFQHRHPFRLRPGFHRSHRPPLSRPSSPTRFRCSLRACHPRSQRHLLLPAHGRAAHHHLVPLPHLAGHRPLHLLLLQPPPLRIRIKKPEPIVVILSQQSCIILQMSS